jgi:GT2 family glycosyltransferase
VNDQPSNDRPAAAPLVSVVILNYHGARYLERCLASLRAQTIFDRLEVIVADNASGDGSPALAEKLLAGWPRGRFVQNGANLGYCEGNNRAVPHATGKYLFILNFDAWLEPDCLERLVSAAESTGAGAASPWVLNYDDDTHQSFGGTGMDFFGLPNAAKAPVADDVSRRTITPGTDERRLKSAATMAATPHPAQSGSQCAAPHPACGHLLPRAEKEIHS